MKTHDFDYTLDESRIAQAPADPRDSSRLMVYDRAAGALNHTVFSDITSYLNPGDILVINETKVIPARLYGKKRGSGTEFEFLLLKRLSLTDWHVIMKPGKKLKPGDYVDFASGFCARLIDKQPDGVCIVSFEYQGMFEALLNRYGNIPLPPYITAPVEEASRYQTVYAKTDGSAAAPTAGLHFTPRLLGEIERKGVKIARILLHVGLGTFRPVKEDELENHTMHSEYYEISKQAAEAINRAKAGGGRVVAVGTTSVRALESAAMPGGTVEPKSGETDIFIYPGYAFKAVDALITNFHLPKSTLLMLVCAFNGRENTLYMYNEAIERGYRFFSFGDAMLIV